MGFEYELNAEHIKLKEVIRDFGSKVVLPLAAKYDQKRGDALGYLERGVLDNPNYRGV